MVGDGRCSSFRFAPYNLKIHTSIFGARSDVMKLVFFVAAVAVLAAGADTPKNEPPGITVVATSDQSVPDIQRAKLAFDIAQSVLGRRRLPHLHLLLIYVDKESGRTQGVPNHADVMMVHFADGQPDKYYVWIVGGGDERLAMAMIVVLSRQWELKLDKKQMEIASARVQHELSRVVSARDLAQESRGSR